MLPACAFCLFGYSILSLGDISCPICIQKMLYIYNQLHFPTYITQFTQLCYSLQFSAQKRIQRTLISLSSCCEIEKIRDLVNTVYIIVYVCNLKDYIKLNFAQYFYSAELRWKLVTYSLNKKHCWTTLCWAKAFCMIQLVVNIYF